MLFYVIVVLCVTLIYVWKKRQDNYWKKQNVTQVGGILWKFLRGDRSLPEHYKEIYDTHDTHVGTFIGSNSALILKDLEDIQAVLVGDFQSFYSRGIITNPGDILADNLLFMGDYKRWKCIRQKLSPVFTSSRLKNMFYIMDKCAKDFVDMLDESKEMRENPYKAVYTYTTASIGSSVFGIDTNASSTMNNPFINMTTKAIAPSFKTNLKIFISGVSPTLFNLLNLKLFGDYEDFFVNAVRNVIESRRNDTVKRHDFIDICLELQEQGIIRDTSTGYEVEPSVEVLAAQAFFFFLAGVDSSAHTMHFFLLQLADHQDVLKKVHEEIDAVFANNPKELCFNDVEKLKYLDMVLNETMRMYPNIGSIQRQCTKDTVLPGSKVRIDKDTVTVVSVYGIHRDEKYHPNPDIFDPERFAPENLANMKNFTFLPFGEGNRICIGARFARLQLKAGIARLLRRYTLGAQKYAPLHFEKSSFSLRDTNAKYTLIPRDIKTN